MGIKVIDGKHRFIRKSIFRLQSIQPIRRTKIGNSRIRGTSRPTQKNKVLSTMYDLFGLFKNTLIHERNYIPFENFEKSVTIRCIGLGIGN